MCGLAGQQDKVSGLRIANLRRAHANVKTLMLKREFEDSLRFFWSSLMLYRVESKKKGVAL